MKNNKISGVSRILLFVCGLALIAVLFVPMWRIDLQAPQYPEGLRMLIYANKLAGNIDIINGLNHYIGMKSLHADDFPEFKILPVIIIFFSAFFIITAFVAKRKWMNLLCILFIVFGIVAMYDFWRWEYNYGHNLDPNAAIIVPGMAYQPPLIGFKQLLNFGAWSAPDIGGWIFVGAGAVLLCCILFEWRRRKKMKMALPFLLIGLLTLTISSCNTQPEPIRIGKDDCDFCKMPISSDRYGAEIMTKKGMAYKFDDVHCIVGFLQTGKVAKEQIAGIYFTDFCLPHKLINVDDVFFLQSPNFKTPMNGNIAAFSSQDSLASIFSKFNGNNISWEEMQK